MHVESSTFVSGVFELSCLLFLSMYTMFTCIRTYFTLHQYRKYISYFHKWHLQVAIDIYLNTVHCNKILKNVK